MLPMGLFALGAMLVPLLIHLIRRHEQAAIDFPALRWLRASTQPRRRLRFDDVGLLLLRLLLIALISLLLSMPVLTGEWRKPRHWVAVAAGVDLDAARGLLHDADAEWRWLAPGFPAVDEAAGPSTAHAASLLREFDATRGAADRLTVFVPEILQGLDAERLQLAHAVDWRILPARATDTDATPRLRRVSLRAGPTPGSGASYLRATLDAWQRSEPERWQIEESATDAAVDAQTDWLIWLGSEMSAEALAWVRAGGRALSVEVGPDPVAGVVVWRDAQGLPLASDETVGAGHRIRLLRPLDADAFPAVLDADFAARIRHLMQGRAVAPRSAWASTVRPTRNADLPTEVRTPLLPLLAIAIALVFLFERVLATRRQSSP